MSVANTHVPDGPVETCSTTSVEKPQSDSNISSIVVTTKLTHTEEIKAVSEDTARDACAPFNKAEHSTDEVGAPAPPSKSWRFVAVIVSLTAINLVTTIDYTIIYPALPTITRDVGGSGKYVWIGNSYALATVAVQPFMSQMADIFGRRQPMLIAIVLFILGAGLAGGATNPAMFIGARAVQGLGSGGISIFLEIIICDLVSQRERGKYIGIMMSVGGVGALVGPVIGGALADSDWRWIFWLSMIIAAIVLVAMFFCLTLKYPRDSTWKQKVARVDYIGNTIFIGSIVSLIFGLVQGSNNQSPWSSASVIVPIVVGVIGWAVFHIYEASSLCKQKTIPNSMFNNRTSVAGFILAFLAGMLVIWATYFLPIYFQALKGASSLRSGIDVLPFVAMNMPAGIIGGTVMAKTGVYRPVHAIGFLLAAVGFGLLSTLDANSQIVEWVWWQFFVALGVGAVFATLLPPIQAPLPDSLVASSVGFFSFMRFFGMLWGNTIPAVIFSARIDANLNEITDPAARNVLAHGGAYQAIASGGGGNGGLLTGLSSATAAQVTRVYTAALKDVWIAAAAFAAISFFIVFLERHVPLRKDVSDEFGVNDGEKDHNKTDGV